jgi:cytochrome c
MKIAHNPVPVAAGAVASADRPQRPGPASLHSTAATARRGARAAGAIALAAVALALAWLPRPALASLELARQHACVNCHAAERKLIGPSYRDVLRRYEGQADAVEQLAQRIRAGGGGRWGPVPMPAQPRLTEAEARELAIWVLQGGR